MDILNPDEIYKQTMSAAKEWADADEEWRSLKETDRIVLAEITNRAEGDSYAERKSKALASPEYRLHKTKMVTAKTKANIMLAKYKAAQDLSNNRRTQEVTHRTEMGIR
jgi:hypothetical protein